MIRLYYTILDPRRQHTPLTEIFDRLVHHTNLVSTWLAENAIDHHVSILDHQGMILMIRLEKDTDAMLFRLRFGDNLVNMD